VLIGQPLLPTRGGGSCSRSATDATGTGRAAEVEELVGPVAVALVVHHGDPGRYVARQSGDAVSGPRFVGGR